jgi:antitoxin component YwqK of YwqJK toxin-antitoxin module
MFRKIVLIMFLFIDVWMGAQNKMDSLGRKQGYWKVYYPNSKHLEYEGFFKDDKPQGLFKYYYEHDTIKAKLDFKKDGKVAYATLYHINGKIMAKGKYLEQKKDSVWEFYNEMGQLLNRENYLQGQRHGLSITYYDSGKVYQKIQYILNKKHGYFIEYFPDKKIKGMGYYKDDLAEGYFVYYDPNGIRVGLITYEKGIRNGPTVIKELDGKIKEKALYKNGYPLSGKESEEYFKRHPEVLNNEFGLDKDIIALFEKRDEKTFTQENINETNKSQLFNQLSKQKSNTSEQRKSTKKK